MSATLPQPGDGTLANLNLLDHAETLDTLRGLGLSGPARSPWRCDACNAWRYAWEDACACRDRERHRAFEHNRRRVREQMEA